MLLAVTGCLGTTDRDDFNRTIQERGGGFTSELPLTAVDAVTGELGVEDFEVRHMTIVALSETVVMEVRDPAAAENIDTYTVRAGDIESVEPIRLSASDDLDAQTFPVSRLALDRIEAMVDTALARFETADGYVTSMTVSQLSEGEVIFQLSLESPRASGTARFSADGELLEVRRT